MTSQEIHQAGDTCLLLIHWVVPELPPSWPYLASSSAISITDVRRVRWASMPFEDYNFPLSYIKLSGVRLKKRSSMEDELLWVYCWHVGNHLHSCFNWDAWGEGLGLSQEWGHDQEEESWREDRSLAYLISECKEHLISYSRPLVGLLPSFHTFHAFILLAHSWVRVLSVNLCFSFGLWQGRNSFASAWLILSFTYLLNITA